MLAITAEVLENFMMHQEGQVSRVPKLIRELTVSDFDTKYAGDMSAALRGIQAERLMAANAAAVARSPKKRKHALDELDGAGTVAESSRAAKNRAYQTVSTYFTLCSATEQHE
jgi:hypothetical protein